MVVQCLCLGVVIVLCIESVLKYTVDFEVNEDWSKIRRRRRRRTSRKMKKRKTRGRQRKKKGK